MRAWPLVVAAGCQFSAGPVSPDGPLAPGAYRISGHASTVDIIALGLKPLSGATVEALEDPAATAPIGSAHTAGDGSYEIAVSGRSTGELLAQATGYLETYLYPAAPVSADAVGLDPIVLSSDTFGVLASLVSVTQDTAAGWIGVRVVDERGQPIAGASIDASGVVKYNGPSGLPAADGTSTQADGTAYVFNAPVGPVPISVLVNGAPFALRTIPVRGNSVTIAHIGPMPMN